MNIFDEIQFLNIEEIFAHEEPNPLKLKNLTEKIKSEKFINHPILVSNIKEKFMILDGTHRYNALKNLHVNLVPAQIVNFPSKRIHLSSWAWNLKIDETLIKFIENFDGKIRTSNEMPKNYQILLISKNDYIINFKNKIEFLTFLNELKKLIENYERVIPTECKEGLVFPKLSHKLFEYLVEKHLTIPSGITRFRIDGRVLFLKVPIEILNDYQSSLKFNKELKKRKYRFYQESVFIFEE
jgi:hypothetical protein